MAWTEIEKQVEGHLPYTIKGTVERNWFGFGKPKGLRVNGNRDGTLVPIE